MHLAGDDHRVDGLAHIVGHAVAQNVDMPGFRIDLDFGDVAAVGEGVVVDIGDLRRVQGGHVFPGRGLLPLDGGQGQNIHAAIRADDGEASVLEHDVGRSGFQCLGGGFLALFDDRGRRQQDRLALGIQAACAACAAADGDGVGVALAHPYLFAVDAEPVGSELHIGGLVALAGGLGADIDIDEPVIGEADFRPFRGIAAGGLQVVGQADAALLALRRGSGPAGREAGEIGMFQRCVQHMSKFAAVIGLAHRRAVRHRRGGYHIAPAQLDPVDLHLPRRRVDQPFDQIVRLRPAGAAIGVHRRGVGEHADDVGVDRLETVDAGQHAGAGEGRDIRREGREIGAHVRQIAGAQGEEFPLRVHGDLADGQIVAALGVAQEGLAALGGPFHRLAQLARGVAGQHVLGVQEQLHTETAADVGGDDAEFLRVGLEHGRGKQTLQQPAALGVGVQRPALAVIIGDGRARFHGRDDDAVVDHAQPGDVRRPGELGLGRGLVADFPVERGVARHVRPDPGGGGVGRDGQVGGGGQDVVLDADRLGGIACLLGGGGDDEGHGIADMAHRAVGQHRMRRHRAGGSVAVLHRHGAGQPADAVRVQIGAGVDRLHAGHGPGRRSVDAGDGRRGMRTAQHDAEQHARQHDVIGVAPVAFQQTRVLDAADGLGETELAHAGLRNER